MRNRAAVLIVVFTVHALCAQTVPVPLVSCESDGQTGPIDAPKRIEPVRVEAKAARGLEYYQAYDGPGVLAPRGWYCFGTYGSSGLGLLVTPNPIKASEMFSLGHKFAGPVIEANRVLGDTSGRFGVARVLARVFPAQSAFVKAVIDESIEPPSEFPFGPYPADKLIVQSSRLVQYQTPPHAEGLGTTNGIVANGDPIDGLAILDGPTPNLLLLRVRLPHELRQLTPILIREFEQEHK